MTLCTNRWGRVPLVPGSHTVSGLGQDRAPGTRVHSQVTDLESCRATAVLLHQLGLTHLLSLIRKTDTQESISFSCSGVLCPLPKLLKFERHRAESPVRRQSSASTQPQTWACAFPKGLYGHNKGAACGICSHSEEGPHYLVLFNDCFHLV